MKLEQKDLFWVRTLKDYKLNEDMIELTTEPNTDLWQRTYYGFQNDNAPLLLTESDEKNFSFTVQAEFEYKCRFDQCGIVLYQDSDNWFKASIEFEDEEIQRLGSVVTNHGYSDWASTDVDTCLQSIYYRLSRRESDYCVEYSLDGIHYKQMRMFHLFEAFGTIQFGIYACSPGESTFTAKFTHLEITECKWQL